MGESDYIYGLDQLKEALTSVGGIATLVLLAVELLKAKFPRTLSGERTALVTLLAGPVITLGAWWLEYMPEGVSVKGAFGLGLLASFAAMGLHAPLKAARQTRETALSKPAGEPVKIKVPRSTKKAA